MVGLQRASSTSQQATANAATSAGAEAFAELYERYFARVYAYLRYRLDTAMDAEDATAAVFERALAKIGGFRSNEAAFATWLLRIARNLATDHYRRRGREERHLALEAASCAVASGPSNEEQVLAEERFQRLQTHLRTLSARNQEIIALKFGFGLTNRRIAELLGMNESTVGSALYTSLRRLRRLLLEEGYGS